MQTQPQLQHAARLAMAALFVVYASAAFGAGLDGATGNICKVDLEKRSFELLKETEYAPKTDIGQSRFTIHWTDQTTITNVQEKESFAGIRGPVIADFHGIDDANAKALAEGKPFEARVAILLPGEKTAAGEDQNHRQVVAWFTPEPGEAPRSGTLEVRGQPVKVSLRKRNARICVHQSLHPADLARGFWKTTLHGAETDGRFVVQSMEVSRLVDPRTVDDPKLPRVLVIGDSVSMNYEEAARTALKGVANFHRIEGNSFSTVQGVRNMDLWLGDYRERGLQWDVIQFNHGLHDLKQAYDKASDRFGDYAVPLEEYKQNLEKEIAILKQTGAKLIWCATTPVPNDNKGPYARRKGAEREFNQAALEVMRRHPDILVNDLCQVVDSSPVFDNWRKGIDVHFYKEDERKLLGDAVAQAVRQVLRLPAAGKPAGTPAAGTAANAPSQTPPCASTGPGSNPEQINWPLFLRQHDMSFDKLPSGWNEAPHFGNAMVGSMLYQEGNALKLQVFRADVHDHRDDTWGWTAYSRPRLQIGHFLLHPVGKLTGCKWHLDLWNAELTGTITTDRGEIRLRHFTHAVDMALVTELSPTAGEKDCSWTWHPAEARTTRGGYPTKESQLAGFARQYGAHYEGALKVFKPNPAGRLENNGETSVWIQDLLGGGQYATAWAEQVHGETRTHIVSIANSYPATNAATVARADLERFLKLDRTGWVQLHRDWWHAYYPRSFVSLPDKSLESLYWQTIYRYGCTTRAGRCFVDTPGLWFQGKSWPYFTTDWNIQSAHWAVYAANRLEQGQALVDRLYEQREELIKAVRPLEWQNDSAYLPLAVAWDLRGSREGDMRYYDLVGTLTWALNNGWSQYRYSMDDAMLREKIYPLLRRAINLYLHLVQEGSDGKLHLPPTYSPETSVCADCNFDLALLKWGCLTLLKASQRLGVADPLIPRWREVAERLPDFPADEYGFRLGRDKSSPANHQHFSHLLMIYPLHLVNLEQPGTAEVLRRSFERARGNAGPGQRQAMVQAHVGPIAAALGLGDEALESLKHLQGDLYPNGLWYESPCIESTLAAANIIQDMLLQSWSEPARDEPGPIRIFPALPSSWKDVEFHDLRAEGAFLVSARRSGGKTAWVRIRSLAGEPCRVRPGLTGELRAKGERQFRLETVAPGLYQVDLNKGEEVLLCAGSEDSRHPAASGSR